MTQYLLDLLNNAIFSAIPAVGFAMVFNIPKRFLLHCAFGGAFAHTLRMLLIDTGLGIEWASLMASTSIGIIAVYWAKKYLVPRLVFTVACVIPMIPGTFAFKTVIGVFTLRAGGYSTEVMAGVMENGLATLFILVALSFGLALPPIVAFRDRPVV